MYSNIGFASGILVKEPYQVQDNVVLITIAIRDNFKVDKESGKRKYHYPTFTAFGREAEKALKLQKGQEVGIEYRLETAKKEINGEVKYFDDKIVNYIQYGRKKEEPSE